MPCNILHTEKFSNEKQVKWRTNRKSFSLFICNTKYSKKYRLSVLIFRIFLEIFSDFCSSEKKQSSACLSEKSKIKYDVSLYHLWNSDCKIIKCYYIISTNHIFKSGKWFLSTKSGCLTLSLIDLSISTSMFM